LVLYRRSTFLPSSLSLLKRKVREEKEMYAFRLLCISSLSTRNVREKRNGYIVPRCSLSASSPAHPQHEAGVWNPRPRPSVGGEERNPIQRTALALARHTPGPHTLSGFAAKPSPSRYDLYLSRRIATAHPRCSACRRRVCFPQTIEWRPFQAGSKSTP